MLSEAEQRDIEAEARHYAERRAVAIDALKIIQHHRGWVSDEALADLAAYLGLSADELDNVATFYNLIFRRPVGRHVILLCNSVSCWMLGYEAVRAGLRERLGIELGETSADGRFTLLPVPCLGACDRAPALLIDGALHEDVTAQSLDALLARYD